jgi:hypothetical protein
LLLTRRMKTEQRRFRLGRTLITPGAEDALEKVGKNPLVFIVRHVLGDWGDVDEHDRLENEFSVRNGLRILSAYQVTDDLKVWVITESDRSVTTILLPEEY